MTIRSSTSDDLDAEELTEERPPVAWVERQRLLGQIRKAAKQLEEGSLSDEQYAAIVMYNSLRLTTRIAAGESLRGCKFDTWTHIEVLEILREASNGDLKKSMKRFGPWNMAGAWLRTAVHGPQTVHEVGRGATWNEQTDEILVEARLRLRWWPRLLFAWEERLRRNRKYFPLATERIGKAGLAIFSSLIGGVVGALLTWLGLR